MEPRGLDVLPACSGVMQVRNAAALIYTWIKIKSIEKTFIKIGGKAGSSPLGLNLNPNSWKRARMDMENNLIQIAVKKQGNGHDQTIP